MMVRGRTGAGGRDVRRRGAALIAAVAMAAAACGGDAAAPPVEPAPTEPSAPAPAPRPEPPAQPPSRTTGDVGVLAASAPEWVANGFATVNAVDATTIVLAQLVTSTAAFELSSVVIEVLGLQGADAPVEAGYTLSVHLAPEALPERFDASDLPELGSGSGAAMLRPSGGDGGFVTLGVAEPFDVPEGRVLVVITFELPEGLRRPAIELSGRRGLVGAEGDCADHNPDARLLERANVRGDFTLPLAPVPEERTLTEATCASGGQRAGFNMTMRLEGLRLTPGATGVLALRLPERPTVVRLEDRDRTPAPGDTQAAPTPAPAPSPAPAPPPTTPTTPDAPPAPAPAPAPGDGTSTVSIGADCTPVRAEARTADEIDVRCTSVWGRRAWRPIPDAVARTAYARITAWWASLPPGGNEVPIERHPDVPVAYEEALRPVFDRARRAHGSIDRRWIALLYPHTEEGIELAIQRVLENVTPSEREILSSGWAVNMRGVRCGTNNQVGYNPETRLGFVVSTIHVEGSSECGPADRPDEHAYRLVREYLMGATSRPPGEPCWAGEGAGWPIGRGLIHVLGGTNWEDEWGFWAAQLMDGSRSSDPTTLGLRRSIEWTLAPSRDQYCYLGVGHVQGSLAHEMLMTDHGFDTWIGNWRSAGGVASFGPSMDAIMDAADARAQTLGIRIE